eukprot:gene23131-29324_t
MPQTLLIARSLLAFIADPLRASWRNGIVLDADGKILKSTVADKSFIASCEGLVELRTSSWWNARACLMHLRLLQKQSYEHIPTLWKEAQDMFRDVLTHFGGVEADQLAGDNASLLTSGIYALHTASTTSVDQAIAKLENDLSLGRDEVVELGAQAWLEWGLCCHHFEHSDRGKKAFVKAKEIVGLQTTLTASLGRRTKYQHTDYAQLFLFARSNLVHRDGSTSSVQEVAEIDKPCESSEVVDGTQLSFDAVSEVSVEDRPVCTDNLTSGWQHAKWELGRRLVNEAEGGEEAAVREVLLDSQDGGAAENILLEGGPQFAEGAKHDKGGELHPIDQAILLALCLDVHNSNADHALTYEEMYPYIERVLLQANNWMVHSTALLERSWLEFERRKTMDRAMLQIQALIDQHSSKLSLSQSTYESVESAAPVQDRLMYLNSIVYGAQYELKRDLANRYLRCQVFVSAMNFFKELEMWDEVVTCYQLLQKPHRAELVVREQLKTGETPYMLTALADLTGKEEYYERAWVVSKGRYPRAKRTLAKICYDRGDFAKCCKYLDEALAVQPLVATAWYLKGIACMRLENWDEGVQAFVRCVQQDMEIGEAWANIGAIHMKQKAWTKAHPALTEALKNKRDSWMILENLMTVCIGMGKWREVVLHMNALLDLRLKSDRPVHVDELRHLAYIVSHITQKEARVKLQKELEERRLLQAESTQPLPEVVMVREMPDLAVHVEKLIVRITNTIKSDPEVWDILAEFQHTLGRFDLELEARLKQCRCWIAEPSWEKFANKVEEMRVVLVQLIEAHQFKDVKKTDWYACKSLLQSALRKMEVNFKTSHAAEEVRGMIAAAEESYKSFA